MNYLTTRVIFIVLPFIILFTACEKEVSSSMLAKHEKAYPELRKKYVYQSLIRLANVNQDPEFEKLIKDVRSVIIYLPPREDSTYQIKDLRSGMRGDGYEELIDIRTAEAQRISLWVKDTDNKPHYVALVDSEVEDLILEIDGEIHPEYLSSIKVADQESLMELLKGGF
jgi:hypothetical protein